MTTVWVTLARARSLIGQKFQVDRKSFPIDYFRLGDAPTAWRSHFMTLRLGDRNLPITRSSLKIIIKNMKRQNFQGDFDRYKHEFTAKLQSESSLWFNFPIIWCSLTILPNFCRLRLWCEIQRLPNKPTGVNFSTETKILSDLKITRLKQLFCPRVGTAAVLPKNRWR